MVKEDHVLVSKHDVKIKNLGNKVDELRLGKVDNETAIQNQAILKSEIGGFRGMVHQLKGNLLLTDIYIDRYLPCTVLNLIQETSEEAFLDLMGRKSFSSSLKKKYDEALAKIKSEENYDNQ